MVDAGFVDVRDLKEKVRLMKRNIVKNYVDNGDNFVETSSLLIYTDFYCLFEIANMIEGEEEVVGDDVKEILKVFMDLLNVFYPLNANYEQLEEGNAVAINEDILDKIENSRRHARNKDEIITKFIETDFTTLLERDGDDKLKVNIDLDDEEVDKELMMELFGVDF